MNFDSLGLKAELLRAVSEQGYASPTPIQQRAIPLVMAGRDLMASAQTGTGKTAAFTLPLLHALSEQTGHQRHPRVLILIPTRELAAQVNENLRAYSRHVKLRSVEIFGGVNINPQISKLQRGVDLVVATPGRLIDHMQRGTINLSGIETLVLDEADRMLDMGFRPAIDRIVNALPKKRQTLLFSATFSKEIGEMAKRYLNNPERVETAPPNSTVDRIAQQAFRVDQKDKREVLSWLIGSNNWRQVLVFTRTKHGANRLARQLEADGLSSSAIHGNKSQAARTKALKEFKQNRIRVLVATDIAARGLDIDQLPHVVNFEIPNVPEDYVHRIGRTGRAGNDGLAVSLVAGSEHGLFEDIRKLVKVEIPTYGVDGYEATEPLSREAGKTPARRGGGGKARAGKEAPNARHNSRRQRSRGQKASGVGGRSNQQGRTQRRAA